MLALIPLLILSYLIGSITTAVLISRALGLEDPRQAGSGNPGATNMLRVAGKKAAILTLLGDFLKGWLPILVIHQGLGEPVVTSLVGLAILLGHMFPVFFGFRGGKGVATALGVLVGYAWPVALSCLATWSLVFWLTRYVSLSSVLVAALAPVFAVYWMPLPYWLGIAVLGAMVIVRHRDNLQRLWRGQEHQWGKVR